MKKATLAHAKSTVHSQRLALESRLVFDGAIVATATEVQADSADNKPVSDTPAAAPSAPPVDFFMDKTPPAVDYQPVADSKDTQPAFAIEPTQTLSPVSGVSGAYATTLIVVDPRADNAGALYSNPPVNTQVIVLDAARDGFQQVSELLQGRHDVTELNVLPWTNGNTQWLGNKALSATLDSTVSNELMHWGDGFSDNADIIFHGTDNLGANWLSHIDALTGADTHWVQGMDFSSAPSRELIVVDTRIDNYQSLLDSFNANAEILFIDPSKDGIQQLVDSLKGRTDISALHILSHGSQGSFTLGTSTLNSDNIDSYQAQLADIGQSLSNDGDILFYGCEVADSAAGAAFVNRLAALTQADISASEDVTGNAAKGGDWVLEYNSGAIETASLVANSYDGLLAAPVNSVPAAQSMVEDSSLTFGAGKLISIGDADGTVSSVTLSVANGTLTLSGIAGLTLTGNGTATIAITGGTITRINAALNGLIYNPTTNYSGTDTLTIVTADATLSDTKTVAITVTPNATAPVLTLPVTSQVVQEDVSSYLNFTATNPIILTDADVNDQQVLTLSVAHGTLLIKTTVAGGVTSATNNGTGTVILTGTAAQLSATLADAQGIQYTSTSNYSSSDPAFAATPEALSFSLSDGVVAHNKSGTVGINVTPVNDAPTFTGATPALAVEGGSVAFSLAQLASSANALDVDIQTGQQVILQLAVKIDSLPVGGTLTYKGGAVAIGSVVPVTDLANLVFTHDGTDISVNQTISFNVTVSDGGGGATAGSMSVTVQPKNVAPSISGAPTLIEGQIKVVAPTINLGDTSDSLANSSITIDNIITGGQGTFFLDANNNNIIDAGETLSGTTTLDATQRANLSTQFKFSQNGNEPNIPATISPSYRITVTDAGGATGIPSAAIAQTITLSVQPNNDDPTLLNTHASAGTALTAQEGNVTAITAAMLKISDIDRNPADLTQTTPENQLVYTVGTRPTQGEIQIDVGGGLGYGGDGWITLGDGGRFTQAQVAAGKVRYYQTTNVPDAVTTPDNFTFTVRDSAYGYDVWTDPANPTGNREGGLRATPTGVIATQQFFLGITPLAASNTPRTNVDPVGETGNHEGAPRPATSGFGGSNMVYSFVPTGEMLSNNSTAGGSWQEANVNSPPGYVITATMLSYTITRTDTKGTLADPTDDISVTVPPNETVYTLTVQPSNGIMQSKASDSWQTIPTNGQFTQADINNSNIRFIHDGSEDHTSTFGYKVSDGTGDPNTHTSTFGLDITPTNDRPTALGGTVKVNEKLLPTNDGLVRLDSSALGMSDVDLSLDITKQATPEGKQDFLWFQVIAQPADAGATQHGELQRWNGSAWLTVTLGEWLPSTLLTTMVGGKTSGLRYAHDGSEPLAYPINPNVTFQYQVRDDLLNPNNPFATDTSAVADSSGSDQSNQSALATTTIQIVPVNNAPVIADKPSDADPTVIGTITDGGALTGVNNVLTNVPEGGTVTITSAFLTAIDQDNTSVQRQYILTSLPMQGNLLLNNSFLGVGSTFTQDDINNNRLTYRHNGVEFPSPTTDALGTYGDKFHFMVSDAVFYDTGANAPNYNTFLIDFGTLSYNDAPTIVAPSGIIAIDSTVAANNLVTGFVIADPDLTNGLQAGETDFVQVTVRLLDSAGTPLTNYSTDFAGAGVNIGYTTQSGGLWAVLKDGVKEILQIQGSRAQVNAALAGLSVTFANDTNTLYKVQVIVDDRMRVVTGALNATGSDANGGELNQAATLGGTPTAVPSTVYDWATTVAVPAVPNGNIASATVDIQASYINETPTFTGPASVTVPEDVRSLIQTNFVVVDPESAGFNTPITVTLSIPSITQGKLDVAGTGSQTSFTPSGGQAISISGDGTAIVTLTGRAADIQALLNQRDFANTATDANGGLYYTSPANGNIDYNGGSAGDVILTLSLNDTGSRFGGDTGSGSVTANPTNISIPITITPVNDTPSIDRDSPTVTISGTTAVTGFVINDVDNTDGGALNVITGEIDFMQATIRLLRAVDNTDTPIPATGNVLGVDHSNVVFSSSTIGGATVDTTYNGNGSALVIRGTLAQVNTYLNGLNVALNGGLNNGTSYRIQVVADDRLRDVTTGVLNGSNAANGGLNSDGSTGTANVPVTAVNPYAAIPAGLDINVIEHTRLILGSGTNNIAPVLSDIALGITRTEDDAAPVGAVGTLISTLASNSNITDANPTDPKGIAITATDSTRGTWYYSTNNGTNWTAFTATNTTARLLAADANTRIYFQPTANWQGASITSGLTIRAWDGSTGSNGTTAAQNLSINANIGGTTAFSSATDVVAVTVTSVNDQPTASTDVVLPAFTEDVLTPNGTLISGLAFNYSDIADNQTGNGGGDTSTAFSYIAIVGSTNYIATQGSWQVSTTASPNPAVAGDWITIPASGLATTSALIFASDRQIRFVPAADFHGTPGTLQVRLADNNVNLTGTGKISTTASTTFDIALVANGGTGITDAWNNTNRNISTTVTAVNDAPTFNGNTTFTATNEDTTSSTRTAANIAAALTYSDVKDNQSTITGGGNTASLQTALAIVGNAATAAQGAWQYTTDGSTWIPVPTGITDTTAVVLNLANANHQIRFIPVANYNGTVGNLTLRAADGTWNSVTGIQDINGVIGTTNPWSIGTATLGITVNPLNDAPVLTSTASNPSVSGTATTTVGVSVDPVALFTGASIADIDLSTTVALTSTVFGAGSITVSFTDTYVAGDVLFVNGVLPAGVSISATDTGVAKALTINLATTTTVAEVNSILNAIAYKSTSSDATVAGTDNTRNYQIKVNDGNNLQGAVTPNAGGANPLDSNIISGTLTISISNTPPVVDLNGAVAGTDNAVTWTESSNATHTAVAINPNATITDSSNTNMTQLIMQAGGVLDGNNEVLNIGGVNFQLGTTVSNVAAGGFLVSYNSTTKIFTVLPTPTTVALATSYQTLIQGITYINNTDNVTTGNRTVTFNITDAGFDNSTAVGGELGSNIATTTINVVRANDQPVITNLNATVNYFENAINTAAALIDSDKSITLTDIDSPTYNGGSLTVSGLIAGQDTVSLPVGAAAVLNNVQINGGNVEYYNGTSWVLIGTQSGGAGANFVVSFNASATPAIVQRVIENLTFANSSNNPTLSRTLNLALNDGGTGTVQNATVGITIKLDNDAPVMTAATLGGIYTEQNATPLQFISGAISVTDPDSPLNFYINTAAVAGSLTVALDGYQTGDTLSVVHQGNGAGQIGVVGNTISYGGTEIATTSGGNGAPLVITFTSATATPAAVQALLAQLAFSNTTNEDPTVNNTDPSRVFTVTLNDGGNTKDTTSTTTALTATLTGTINLTAVNDKPVVTSAGAAAAYTENAVATVVDNTVTVTDADDTQMNGGTISITGNFLAGDVLAITDTGNITGSYNAATGVLTLSGLDSIANYQAVLRSLTYLNSTDDPTDNTTKTTRTLTYSLTDANSDAVGAATSLAATKTINLTPLQDAPVLTGGGATLTYTEQTAAAVIDATVTVSSDADDTQMSGATITLSAGYTAGDILNFTAQNGITVVSNSGGVLVLTGNATLANYTAALRSISFNSTSDTPTIISASRTVIWQVRDANSDAAGVASSNTVTSTINILALNDTPVLTALGNTVNFTEIDTAVVLNTAVTVADVDLSPLSGGAGNYNGTTLTLMRNGGANAADVFSSTGTLAALTQGGNVTVGGTTIGTVTTNSAGTLVLTFNTNATTARINSALQQIAYRNNSATPQASVQIDWLFNDQNPNITGGGILGTGQDQGGGGVLSASGSTTINIDRLPTANADTNSIAENALNVTGNVMTGATTADDQGDPAATVTGVALGTQASTSGSVNTAITGSYGSLTLDSTGAYTYTLDNTNPLVNKLLTGQTLTETYSYTIRDADGDTSTTTLTITINGATDGAPTVVPDDINTNAITGHISVRESGLTSGADTSETTTGTLQLSALGGLASINVGGTAVTLAQLNTLGATPITIVTPKGTITLTGYNSTANVGGVSTTGTLTYTYTLTQVQNTPAATENTDNIALSITNAGGNTVTDTLIVQIVDDTPTTNADVNSVNEGTSTAATTTSGNVFSGSATDVADRIGADVTATPVTGVALGIQLNTSGNINSPVTGNYGSLTLNATGGYTYTLNNTNPAVNALLTGETLLETYSYTITDADGDTSTTTLTITIRGITDSTPEITPVDGNNTETGQATVFEKGLVTPSDGSQITTGTVSVTAPDGMASVTVGGTVFTVAQLATFSVGSPSASINTGEGTLVVTGFNIVAGPNAAPTAGTLTYRYTLNAAQPQSGGSAVTESTDRITLVVTDSSSLAHTATSTLIVRIVDDTPTGKADTNSVIEGTTTAATTTQGNVFGAIGASAGDVADRIGADATATPVTGVSFAGSVKTVGSAFNSVYGSLTLNANGSYIYTLDNTNPTVNALGLGQTLSETFSYTITDADGDTSTTTLTITINGRNDAPIAVNDIQTGSTGQPVIINVLGNDHDPENDINPATVKIVGTVNAGDSLEVAGEGIWSVNRLTGAITFTPFTGFTADPTPISYTVTDKAGLTSNPATVTVDYPQTPPLAVDNSVTGVTGKPVTITVVDNDSDAENDINPATLHIVGTANAGDSLVVAGQGTWSVDISTGTITFTPNLGFTGSPTPISYTVSDNTGLMSNAARLTVNYPAVIALDTGTSGSLIMLSNPDKTDSSSTYNDADKKEVFELKFKADNNDLPPERLNLYVPLRNYVISLTGSLRDQVVLELERYSFSVPRWMFRHTDPNEQLEFEAARPDGSSLPEWMTFNPKTLKFSGVPPKGAHNERVMVTARDTYGNEVHAIFNVHVNKERMRSITSHIIVEKHKLGEKRAVGKASLSEQIHAMGKFNKLQESRALLDSFKSVVSLADE